MRFLRSLQVILALAIFLHESRTVSCIDVALAMASKYCVMERVKRMLTYSCHDLKLKEVPQYLKSSVEILDLSENRIRDLTRESFNKYTDIKYLYLAENMIQTVEAGTFAQLSSLEVIDLSGNALTSLPLELFQLGYLRTLYAADNNLFDLQTDLEDLRTPIRAPLQLMSLSMCKLQFIPNFGLMPNLLHLNVSLNPMTKLDTEQLAPMCNLKTIDLNGTQMSGCVCQQVRQYLGAIPVYIKNGPNYCDNSGSGCSLDSTNTTAQLYAACVATKAALVQEERKSSILIYAAIGAGCLAVLLLLCCCCIRNRKIARRRKEQKKAAAARRRARKMKEAAEQRLISGDEEEQKKKALSDESDCEKIKNGDRNTIIRVDIEKVPPGD